MNIKDNEIIERWKSPTPPFFSRLAEAGVILSAIGAGIIASPHDISFFLVEAGEYLLVVGGVLTVVSRLAVE